MKNATLFLILVLFLVSCKKKYNCSCSTTIIDTYYYSQAYHVSETKPMSKKMTKKEAEAVCEHEEKNINDTYMNLFTNSGTQSSYGMSATTVCKIK
jgi:hypothetical protein